jgi:hypothetical protein
MSSSFLPQSPYKIAARIGVSRMTVRVGAAVDRGEVNEINRPAQPRRLGFFVSAFPLQRGLRVASASTSPVEIPSIRFSNKWPVGIAYAATWKEPSKCVVPL